MVVASHFAAPEVVNAVPIDRPAPYTMNTFHGTFSWASFQLSTPSPGSSNRITAMMPTTIVDSIGYRWPTAPASP